MKVEELYMHPDEVKVLHDHYFINYFDPIQDQSLKLSLADTDPKPGILRGCLWGAYVRETRMIVPGHVLPIPGGVVIYTLNEPTGMPYPKENLVAD